MSTLIKLNSKTWVTPEGGLAVVYTNDTGAPSVKGSLVEVSTAVDDAISLIAAGGNDPIGVIYQSGIADGSAVLVVVSGKAQILLEDATASTRGYWACVSGVEAGRVDATNAAPPGGAIGSLDNHMTEVGHCLQSVIAGVDQLAWFNIHFL